MFLLQEEEKKGKQDKDGEGQSKGEKGGLERDKVLIKKEEKIKEGNNNFERKTGF